MSEFLSGNAHSQTLVTNGCKPIHIEVTGPQIYIKFFDGNFVEIGRSPHQNLNKTLKQIEDIILDMQNGNQPQLAIMKVLYNKIPSDYSIITFKEA